MLEAKARRGVTYVHTPIRSMEHQESISSQRLQQFEDFLNLGHEEVSIYNVTDREDIRGEGFCHAWTEQHLHLMEIFRGELQRKFMANKQFLKMETSKAAGKTAVATIVEVHVHMRRGDVSQQTNSDRYVPVENYIKILELLEQGLREHALGMQVHIHSEGKPKEPDFVRLKREFSAVLHLNEDVLQTFYALAAAPIFVMGRSSFSSVAAMYNQGLVIYTPFTHGPLPSFLVFDTGNPGALQKQLGEERARDVLLSKLKHRCFMQIPGYFSYSHFC